MLRHIKASLNQLSNFSANRSDLVILSCNIKLFLASDKIRNKKTEFCDFFEFKGEKPCHFIIVDWAAMVILFFAELMKGFTQLFNKKFKNKSKPFEIGLFSANFFALRKE